MYAVLLGPPGAGKGTQAAFLCESRKLLHLSTGDLLRAAVSAGTPLGAEAKAFMDRGELVPDSLVLRLLEARLGAADAGEGFLLDGFPRSVSQAKALDGLLSEGTVDHVIYLHLEDQEIMGRLLKRGRPDDTQEVIQNRLEVYRAETQPLVAYYRERSVLRTVDATGTIEDVRHRVDEAMAAGSSEAKER